MAPDSVPDQPAQPAGANGMTATQAKKNGKRGNPQTRILYVDDEPDLLELAKLFLESDGEFEVTTATAAPEVVREFECGNFDAIVSDYQMPGMDGIQFLSTVRSRCGRIPFILFTGRGREEVVIQAINNGVDFYLQKGGDAEAQFAELALKIRQATSRKKAEDLLRKREEDYQHLIEHSEEAIGIIQDGLIRRVNPPILALTGYSEEELVARPFAGFIHPDDRAMVVDRYMRRMRGEEPPSQYAIRLVRKDLSVIWLEISTVVITWDGRPATINFLVDVTKRVLAEKELTNARQYLDRILNSIADPVFVKDEKHRRVLANDAYCRFLGLDRTEILNRDDYDLFPHDIAEGLSREDALLFSSGTERVTEEKILDGQGAIHLISTKKTLFTDSQNRRFIVGVSRDITERKKAEDDARRTRENFEAFFDSINEFLFVLDGQGLILYVNATVCRRLGYSREELAGQHALKVHPPEMRQEALRIVQEMLSGRMENYRIPVMTKDGQLVPVETTITRGTWNGKPALFGVSREIPPPG